MTQQLDPWEIYAGDDTDIHTPQQEWELPVEGAACTIEDTDCEACQ